MAFRARPDLIRGRPDIQSASQDNFSSLNFALRSLPTEKNVLTLFE